MYTDVWKSGMISVTCESLELIWITSSVYKLHNIFCSSTDAFNLWRRFKNFQGLLYHPKLSHPLLNLTYEENEEGSINK